MTRSHEEHYGNDDWDGCAEKPFAAPNPPTRGLPLPGGEIDPADYPAPERGDDPGQDVE